ncbi:MAG: substrate-binding domain-containing protein [Fimbriimonadaceae bacterium]|nr:substrate-binding domain-containing protein [Fimbriimonadaceae bacterium]
MATDAGGGRTNWGVTLGCMALVLVGGLLLVRDFQGRANRAGGSRPSDPLVTSEPAAQHEPAAPPASQEPLGKGQRLLVYYERSARGWIEEAANEFNRQHDGRWQVELSAQPSRGGKQDILYGKAEPVLWGPADAYWIEKLERDWRSQGHSGDLIRESETIAQTRLVLVTWTDRAAVLQGLMQQPAYRGQTWKLLADLGARGWGAVAGKPEWGDLKLLHSQPTLSNSGQTALWLLLAELRRATPGLPATAALLRQRLDAIEGAVQDYPETTSKALEAFFSAGPGAVDICLAYEANAVKQLKAGASSADFAVLYPSPTSSEELPLALLDRGSLDPDLAAGGRAFVAYLRSPAVQGRLLAATGLRPVLPELRSDVTKTFETWAAAGLRVETPLARRPPAADIDALLYLWHQRHGGG